MDDIKEIYNRMMESKEREIKFKIWMFKNNVSICDGNFRDLYNFYNAINKCGNIEELRKKTDYQKHIELINLDMLRRISNYLSSAFTLVGYARDYMKENYAETETFNIYEKQVKEQFINNNLAKFIQDLRNYFLHNGISGFSYGFSAVGSNVGDTKFSTILQKKDINKGRYFSAKSKEYLSLLPNQIDIMIELQKYHNIVLSFYKWLFDYLGTLHKEDIEKAKQYEREYCNSTQ